MKKIEQLTQDEKFMGYYDLEEKHKWHASKTNRLAKSMLEKKNGDRRHHICNRFS